MRKSISFILIAVLIFMNGLVAIASNEPEKPAELTVWLQKTFSEEFNNALADLFIKFGEENGIAVSAEVIDAAALRDTKIPAALESASYPNISYMEPAGLVKYAKQGIIISAQSVIDDLAANSTDFIPAILETTFVDGKPCAVPFSVQSWLLWYRKDLLSAAGFNHPPSTWDEMLEMSIATTKPTEGIYGAGLAAGATASDFNNTSQSILWSYGGSVMKDGKLNLNSEESKAALLKLLEFFTNNTVAPDMIGGDDMANNLAMLSGSTAFIVNIPTIANALANDAPDIWENTGAAPMPAGPEGSFPLFSANYMSILDNGEAENYWSAKALSYVVDKSRLAPLMNLIKPAYGMVYADTMEMEEYMSDPVVAAHMKSITTGKYYNYPDDEFTQERAALTASSTYINNIIAYVVVEGMSFEDALQRQIDICEQVLAQ